MLEKINIWLWLGLFVSYGIYEYVGTKNIIATNKLKATEASNTGAMMYVIGILGTYLCVVDGLVNIIPIILGSWLGTYYSVKAEIKIQKKKKNDKSRTNGKGSAGVLGTVQKKESGLWGRICRLWCSWCSR